MAKTFDDLSPEQVAEFAAKCEFFGGDLEQIPCQIHTAQAKNGLVCGHPAGSPAFSYSKTDVIQNVRELNTMGGCGDERNAQFAWKFD